MNLFDLASEKPGLGALWGGESTDLDYTLVAWPEGSGVAAHVNGEVDVLMVVLEGAARVVVDGTTNELEAGSLLLIPVGTERQVTAVSDRLVYLNVHKRKKKMRLSPVDSFRNRVDPT